MRELPPPVRMAKKLDPYRETARMALEPWLVEAALACLPQTLSPAYQRTIVEATRTPPTGSGGRSGGANAPNSERTFTSTTLADLNRVSIISPSNSGAPPTMR
jgi:hypothetical protein